MANTASAKKAVRKIERRTKVNRARRSKMRTQIRKAEEAIHAGEATTAAEVVRETESTIMRAAQKGILHKNTAARKVARLAAKVRHLATAAAAS
jgi:small subunit ribosomal protein S20